MNSHAPASSWLGSFLTSLPVLGYISRCINNSLFGELALLGLTLLMAVVLAVLVFGVPVLTYVVEAAALIVFLTILAATRG